MKRLSQVLELVDISNYYIVLIIHIHAENLLLHFSMSVWFIDIAVCRMQLQPSFSVWTVSFQIDNSALAFYISEKMFWQSSKPANVIKYLSKISGYKIDLKHKGLLWVTVEPCLFKLYFYTSWLLPNIFWWKHNYCMVFILSLHKEIYIVQNVEKRECVCVIIFWTC